MGQETSKNRSKAPHRENRNKKSKMNGLKYNGNAVHANNYNGREISYKDYGFLNGHKPTGVPHLQGEQPIHGLNDSASHSSHSGQMRQPAPIEGEDNKEIYPDLRNMDSQNRYRVRRFRDKLAHKLRRPEIQFILETFLRSNVFNRKEYCEIKNQLQTKWMSWRLAYTLELKMRQDDLAGQATVFNLFIECLESPQVRRSKLAARLMRESGDPSPSWCSDGKDEGVLDCADGLVLTPTLLESVLSHVHCNDNLSWWRWIPYELGLRDFSVFSMDQDTSDMSNENQHTKLKNALVQWGAAEGFARGGLEILLLTFRNHIDACEVNWKGLKKFFRSKRPAS